MSAPLPWQGELWLGSCVAIFRGMAGDTGIHRHLAAQAVAGDGTNRLATADGVLEGPLLLIDPLVPHRLLPAATPRTVVFVEPGHEATARPWRLADRGAPAHLLSSPDRPFWSAPLPGDAPAAAGDPLVAKALERLEPMLAGRLALAQLAATVRLSPSRFRHRFAAAMGVPFRRYVLWRRLHLAARCIGGGASATEAAHAAGFADAAHFSRTLGTMFGVSPRTSLLRMRVAAMEEGVQPGPREVLRNGSRNWAR